MSCRGPHSVACGRARSHNSDSRTQTPDHCLTSMKFDALSTLFQTKFPQNWPDIQRRCGFWRLDYRNQGFSSKNICVFLKVATILCSFLVVTLGYFPPLLLRLWKSKRNLLQATSAGQCVRFFTQRSEGQPSTGHRGAPGRGEDIIPLSLSG